MTRAYVALGANLGEPVKALHEALEAIGKIEGTKVLATSSFYVTEPIDSSGPDYVNAVASVETTLAAADLLRALFAIENAAHRVRPEGVKNAPRTLDLDLLLYGETVQNDAFLTLPHPRMHERAFVLVPLAEIDPACEIPGRGRVAELLKTVAGQRIERLS